MKNKKAKKESIFCETFLMSAKVGKLFNCLENEINLSMTKKH